MKPNKTTKASIKTKLSRETVRVLAASQLANAAGGGGTTGTRDSGLTPDACRED